MQAPKIIEESSSGQCPFHQGAPANFTCWNGYNPYQIKLPEGQGGGIPIISPLVSALARVISLIVSVPGRWKNSARGQEIYQEPDKYISKFTELMLDPASDGLIPYKIFQVFGSTFHLVTDPQLQRIFFEQGQTGGDDRVVFGGETLRLLTQIIGPHSLMTCTPEEHKIFKPLLKTYFEDPLFLRSRIPSFIEWGRTFSKSHLLEPGNVSITDRIRESVLDFISAHIGLPTDESRLRGALNVLEAQVSHLAFKKSEYSKDAVLEAQKTARKVIEEARRQLSKDSPHSPLKALHELDGITDEQIFDNMLLMLFGGRQEASTVLLLILYHLGKQPGLIDQIYEEYQSKRENIARYINKGKTLLDSVLWETLRLYPPIYGAAREATTPFEIVNTDSGEVVMDVRRGDGIILPIVIPQRDRARFGEDADEWNPRRFQEMSHGEMVRPFGVGPSKCLAIAFAPQMIKSLFLGIIVEMKENGFTFETLNKTLEISTTDNLHSKHDIRLKVLLQKQVCP